MIFRQRRGRQKLPDGQPSDRDHQLGPQQVELRFQPPAALRDLRAVGHAVAAGGSFAGETPAHRLPCRPCAGTVPRRSRSPRAATRRASAPAVHANGRPLTGSCRPGAWPTSTTRLTVGVTRHRRTVHPRAAHAGAHRFDVCGERGGKRGSRSQKTGRVAGIIARKAAKQKSGGKGCRGVSLPVDSAWPLPSA